MILYNVTINISNEVKEEWLEWLKTVHIPKVMATQIFSEYKICRLLYEVDNGGTTYCVQYFTKTLDHLEHFKSTFPELREEANPIFKDKIVTFRTELEVL